MSPIKLTLGRALRFQAWVRFVAVIVLLPCRWLTRRRPLFLASAGQGGWRCLVCAGARSCRLHGALVARSLRAARAARSPRGRGATRPYPRTPARGKLSLQAFARCARVLRFAQGVLCSRTQPPVCLCWRILPPAVCAAPEAIGAAGFPGGSLTPISARSSEPKVE